MFVIILTAVVSLVLGVVLTLSAEWYLFSQPANKSEPRAFPSVSPVKIQLPEELLAKLEGRPSHDQRPQQPGAGSVTDDSSLAVNLLIQFLFRELRFQGAFRRLIIQKINQEMDEVLGKGQVRKIIKGLKIYDVDLGSRAPSISSIRVNRVDLDADRHIESLNFVFSVEYSGGFSIAIDAALAYGTSAFLSSKVSRLVGEVDLRFSRQPFSHWSLAFYRPPVLDFDIKSRVQGRSFQHVTQMVAAQIQKLIQRKHTLPRYRIRYKPFFRKPEESLYESEASKQAVRDRSKIKEGTLEVTVMELTRLNPILIADGIYCTFGLGDCTWLNVEPSPVEGHILLDVRVVRDKNQALGIVFEPTPPSLIPNLIDFTAEEQPVNSVSDVKESPVIHEIQPDTPAHFAGLRAGDVVVQIDQTPVKTADDVLRVFGFAGEYCLLRIDRPLAPKNSDKENGTTAKPNEVIAEGPSAEKEAAIHEKSDNISGEVANEDETLSKLPRRESKASHGVPDFGVDIQRTATYPMSETTVVNETRMLRIKEDHLFLNLSVWTTGNPQLEIIKDNSSNANPAGVNLGSLFKSNKPDKKQPAAEVAKINLLGHLNIPLSEIIDDCLLNTQSHHVSVYKINPSDEQAFVGRQNPLAGQAGFDPRLCYGDVLLSFVYRPEEAVGPAPFSSPSPLQPAQPPITSSTTTTSSAPHAVQSESHNVSISKQAEAILNQQVQRPHDFALTNFTNVRLCDACNKKIWLREALQCRVCGTVFHKKCIKRSPEKSWCTSGPPDVTLAVQNAGGSVIEGGMSDLIKVVESSLPTNVSELQSYLEANPFLMSEDDEMDELHVAVERLLSRKHDESLVTLAKDSGRQLYSHLNISERRSKISLMITRLEAAIEIETIRRSTLAVKAEMAPTAEEKKAVQGEMAVCEEKRQALALLLLHYCAGLQYTEETDESGQNQRIQGSQATGETGQPSGNSGGPGLGIRLSS